MSFAEMKQRTSEQLEMKVALDRPYKLCDFKTAYGTILEDYLEEYDFWGCTDLDLVYGRIDDFITDDVLNQHDVIAARPWYLTGFFFLFRNCERTNQLYEQSRDHERVYQNDDHFSFIECNFAWQQLRNGTSIFDADTDIESMTEVIRREEQNGLQVHFSEMARESVDWRPLLWNRDRLTEGGREWLLFHFVFHKDHWAFSLPNWKRVPDSYYISKFGLWNRDTPLTGPLRDIDWSGILQRGTKKTVERLVGNSNSAC
nr:DUF6625 family protein [Salinibacter sp.]